MNFFKSCIIFGVVIILSACSNTITDKKIDNELQKLLEDKNYFKLEAFLAKNEDKLSEDRLLYYQALLDNSFGKANESNKKIEVLMDKYKDKLSDSIVVDLLSVKASNFIANYNYNEASNVYKELLKNYKKEIDSVEYKDFDNAKNLFGAFANVKPQVMQKHNTVTIKSYRNKFNHLMTPVHSNGVKEEFIFDTGANLSTIAESVATKMKFTIFEQKVKIGSSTKIKVNSKLAVADSLYLGDILFQNVVFLVLPDEQLTFPQANYKIQGIIGSPVIHQLEEMHLHKDGSITIPAISKEKNLKNMVFEGLQPVVRVQSGSDDLLFTLDTGANSSDLSFKYYTKHKKQVEKQGKLLVNNRAGAGGVAVVKVYELEDFPFKIGTKTTKLSKISVSLEEYDFNKYYDGNLGQDVFTNFNTLILNFKNMYIDVE
jgi:predicted aspartyl protease